MNTLRDVTLPDIGDFDEVEVIEILIAVGDSIAAEDSMITLESDKATMEIPAPANGTVKDIKVSLGDKIAVGALILTLEEDADDTTKPKAAEIKQSTDTPTAAATPAKDNEQASAMLASSAMPSNFEKGDKHAEVLI